MSRRIGEICIVLLRQMLPSDDTYIIDEETAKKEAEISQLYIFLSELYILVSESIKGAAAT